MFTLPLSSPLNLWVAQRQWMPCQSSFLWHHCPAQSMGCVHSWEALWALNSHSRKKAPHLVECLAISMLKFLILFEPGTPPSPFCICPCKLGSQHFTWYMCKWIKTNKQKQDYLAFKFYEFQNFQLCWTLFSYFLTTLQSILDMTCKEIKSQGVETERK